ncbi:MAG: hypothetical protein WA446_18615, partial [Steroidobacteraceae bacterium]
MLIVQVSPGCRYQRARTVREHQRQLEFAIAVHPTQHVQRHPLERVALTNNCYLLRIPSEVVVGSLSSGS